LLSPHELTAIDPALFALFDDGRCDDPPSSVRLSTAEIGVSEIAAHTLGMFARAATPLTRIAQGMAKALLKAGRELAFSC
jgi:hypothetical protein